MWWPSSNGTKGYGPAFNAGDRVGCGWLSDGSVFFTLNGKHLGLAYTNVWGNFFPAVGMETIGACLEITFGREGQQPLRFNGNGRPPKGWMGGNRPDSWTEPAGWVQPTSAWMSEASCGSPRAPNQTETMIVDVREHTDDEAEHWIHTLHVDPKPPDVMELTKRLRDRPNWALVFIELNGCAVLCELLDLLTSKAQKERSDWSLMHLVLDCLGELMSFNEGMEALTTTSGASTSSSWSSLPGNSKRLRGSLENWKPGSWMSRSGANGIPHNPQPLIYSISSVCVEMAKVVLDLPLSHRVHTKALTLVSTVTAHSQKFQTVILSTFDELQRMQATQCHARACRCTQTHGPLRCPLTPLRAPSSSGRPSWRNQQIGLFGRRLQSIACAAARRFAVTPNQPGFEHLCARGVSGGVSGAAVIHP